MREILFRGKRVDNGEWVIGYYVQKQDPLLVGVAYHCILTQEKDSCGCLMSTVSWYKVVPESIGQFTGMKDKNGKRVYEGDIVTTDIERPYLIVEFRDGCFMFNCNDGGKDYYDIMLPIVDEPHTEYKYGEVIGNIHDNPELMEAE